MAVRTIREIKYKTGTYLGEFDEVHHLADGRGRYDFKTGDCYEGQYEQGIIHGEGTYTSAKTGTYSGSFVQSKREGKGTLERDGQRYEGKFVQDQFDGHGEHHYRTGDVYTGEWSEGNKSGLGTYTYAGQDTKVPDSWCFNPSARVLVKRPSIATFTTHYHLPRTPRRRRAAQR